MSILSAASSRFYTRYKSSLRFNKNLIISGVFSLVVAAGITEYYDIHNNGRNNVALLTFISFVAEYTVEIPIFVTLFYYDNKQRYSHLGGKKNLHMVKKDIAKLCMIFSISDAAYFLTLIFIEFYLLHSSSIQAYQAVIYSSVMAWVVYFIIVNTIIKIGKVL